MEQWEEARCLLVDDHIFITSNKVYNDIVEVMRKIRRSNPDNFPDMDKDSLHSILHEINYCKRMVKLLRKQDEKYSKHFIVNTKCIHPIADAIHEELNQRTVVSLAKPTSKEIRQLKAKQNKSYGRGTNR
jgi:hypothetical protein